MDIVFAALRFIHILTAVAWVGLGLATTFYIVPAAAAAGDSGLRFLKSLMTRTPYPRTFAIVAGITTLAGILMYALGAHNHFSTLGNIVLGIGALAGIAATIHGGAVTGRATRALGEALVQHVPDGEQSLGSDGLSVLRERAQELGSHSRISMILMIVALIGMAGARYL
jgi:hypothetical protein